MAVGAASDVSSAVVNCNAQQVCGSVGFNRHGHYEVHIQNALLDVGFAQTEIQRVTAKICSEYPGAQGGEIERYLDRALTQAIENGTLNLEVVIPDGLLGLAPASPTVSAKASTPAKPVDEFGAPPSSAKTESSAPPAAASVRPAAPAKSKRATAASAQTRASGLGVVDARRYAQALKLSGNDPETKLVQNMLKASGRKPDCSFDEAGNADGKCGYQTMSKYVEDISAHGGNIDEAIAWVKRGGSASAYLEVLHLGNAELARRSAEAPASSPAGRGSSPQRMAQAPASSPAGRGYLSQRAAPSGPSSSPNSVAGASAPRQPVDPASSTPVAAPVKTVQSTPPAATRTSVSASSTAVRPASAERVTASLLGSEAAGHVARYPGAPESAAARLERQRRRMGG